MGSLPLVSWIWMFGEFIEPLQNRRQAEPNAARRDADKGDSPLTDKMVETTDLQARELGHLSDSQQSVLASWY